MMRAKMNGVMISTDGGDDDSVDDDDGNDAADADGH